MYNQKSGNRSVAHNGSPRSGAPVPALLFARGGRQTTELQHAQKADQALLLFIVLLCSTCLYYREKTKHLRRSLGRLKNPNFSPQPQSLEGEKETLIHREVSELQCSLEGLLGHFQILCLKLCWHLKSS